ncbi:hypothetical protein HOK09_03210, partial [Candidatus Woesearchaeota archaeon]|nr:hypothetical protein [Candidatus Woesearchaeota archaeon]
MTEITWEELAKVIAPRVLHEFYNPLVYPHIKLEDKIEGIGTAYFDFKTNETHVSKEFLDQLVEHGEMDPETALAGIYKHEVGHYVHYPRECAELMFLGHLAESSFGEYAKDVLAYWVDLKDNLPQILKEKTGKDVRELYKGFNLLIEKEEDFTEKQKEVLRQHSKDPEQVMEDLKRYSIDRLLISYYQEQTKEDLGVHVDDEYFQEKLSQLMTLDFGDESANLQNFILFGNYIMDVLEKRKNILPKSMQNGGGGSGSGQGEGTVMGRPINIGDFTDEQIEDGLDSIIRGKNKGRYERVKEYVERQTGKNFDRTPPKSKGKGIGLGSSDLKNNDDQIGYYERLAATYGMFIHKKPIVVDSTDSFPEGSERFRVGDAIKTLDPFSTGGRILPSITRRKKLKQSHKRDRLYKVPNANVIIDSSGSMEDPRNGSNAVLAGFILGRNYHNNGAKVGAVNFSVDTAFLMPTRELNDFYSMMCAFWNGGTALNIPKIKEYMERVAHSDVRDMPRYFTTEQEYEHFLGSLSPEKQKEFVDKDLELNLRGRIKETYEKVDNFLITDGGIANIDEVVGYLNSLADVTRNTIFLIDNSSDYKIWTEATLPNTQIIPVDKPTDLRGLAVGAARRIVPDDDKIEST